MPLYFFGVIMTEKKTKSAAKRADPQPSIVWFESRNPEPSQFDVAGISSIRRFTDNHLEWEVAADDVARFEQDHFVQNCRVVRKRDG